RNLFYMLIIAPLWVSYLVRIIAWKTILGNKGLINIALMNLGITKEPVSAFLYNQVSVVLTLTYIAIPFVFIPLYTALEKIPNNLIDAARDLGASEFNTFVNVIFPLSLPGLVTGFMLSFIIALGDYIIPSQLGGNSGIMYGNVVWAQFGGAYNWPFGSALGFILFFIAAIVLVIAQIFGSKEGIFAE
ncbi:MAG: ABC transporter permease, partial [Chitinophagaceae bacterium]